MRIPPHLMLMVECCLPSLETPVPKVSKRVKSEYRFGDASFPPTMRLMGDMAVFYLPREESAIT
jgi:hypothetical protein